MNNIISANFQLQNDIAWTNYTNLHDSLSVTNSSNAMFPSAYTVDKRIASGEIRQYQTDNNITQFDDFSTNTDLTITAKNVSGDADFFEVAINLDHQLFALYPVCNDQTVLPVFCHGYLFFPVPLYFPKQKLRSFAGHLNVLLQHRRF